jgi:hypothetical protein
LEHNHYNKRLVLGEVKTAQALNAVGDILYEVVYSDIIDNMKTIPQSVSTIFGDVYPNSLDNMRNRVIDKTGQVSTELPTWMLSKQPNGNILGFTTAWVIAYTLPGQSNSVAYNISRKFGNTLNKINFVADRYTLQAQFTQNWDAEDQRWYPTDITSFDIYNHGISADSVDTSADVADVDITADLTNASTIETTFDKRSCVFIGVRANKADITTKTSDTISISADNGSKGVSTTFLNTDKYNKYLLFPKQDIINTKQTNNII